MKIIKRLGVLSALLSIFPVYALDTMLDEELAQTVAQDGLSIAIKLPSATLAMDSIGLLDKDGIAFDAATNFAGYNNRGDFRAKTIQLQGCTESTIGGACTLATNSATFNITMDADGGVGGVSPTVITKFSLGSSVNKIRFNVDKLSIRGGATGSDVNIIDLSYIDIAPTGSKNLLTMQFGNQPQGNMIRFTNANFGTIDFGNVKVLDKNDLVNGGACATCSVNFDFAIASLDFTGAGIDVSDMGLVFSVPSFVTPVDVTMQNIKMGTADSMGSFGIKGLQVSNLQIAVSGI